MPELPEVETISRQLNKVLVGRKIISLKIIDKKLKNIGDISLLEKATILRVIRSAKEVVFILKTPKGNQRIWLCFHLRMTGALVLEEKSADGDKKHIRAILQMNGQALQFWDVRRFGQIKIYTSQDFIEKRLEPLSKKFTVHILAELLGRNRHQEIKSWLLRQDKVVGIGNIYASEILYKSKIHPTREVGFLNVEEIKQLHSAIKYILNKAIKYKGTTFSDYKDANNKKGGFQNFLKVYQKDKTPCQTCGKEIKKLTQNGRSTFFCPGCQK